MIMIVVDTNIIVYNFISGEMTDLITQVFKKDPDWVAPRLWRSEFQNAIVQSMRHKVINYEKAVIIMNEAISLMARGEFSIASEQVFQASLESSCSAYDCEFVALAKDLGAPLITADQQIVREFPEIALSPEQFLKAT